MSHMVASYKDRKHHMVSTASGLWSRIRGERTELTVRTTHIVDPICPSAQCVKPVTFSQVSVLPKLTLLSCHLGRPESRSKACLSCSSHFDPFYGQKVPKMAINAVFWP